MKESGPTLSARALAYVQAHPEGATAKAVALAIGVSHATAAAMLARHFWSSAVDRRLEGRSFLYTVRDACLRPTSLED